MPRPILTPTKAREMAAARKTRGGGQPPKLTPCPWCRAEFGAAALRKHLAGRNCPKRP